MLRAGAAIVKLEMHWRVLD